MFQLGWGETWISQQQEREGSIEESKWSHRSKNWRLQQKVSHVRKTFYFITFDIPRCVVPSVFLSIPRASPPSLQPLIVRNYSLRASSCEATTNMDKTLHHSTNLERELTLIFEQSASKQFSSPWLFELPRRSKSRIKVRRFHCFY